MEIVSTDVNAIHFEKAALAKGLSVRKVRKSIFITNGIKQVRVNNSLVGDSSPFAIYFNKKAASKLLLKTFGANVLDGFLFHAYEKQRAIEYAASIGWPVVIKPDDEHKGRHVYLNIYDEKDFSIKFDRVVAKYGSVLVEKQCPFLFEYRFYVAGGKVLAVSRRDPASVTGDGVTTIKELIENKNILRKKRRYPLIKINSDVKDMISSQNVGLDSVPKVGEKIFLSLISNLSSGGDSVAVLDKVDRSYIDAIEDISARFLRGNVFIAGYDVLIDDISQPAAGDNWFICEVNKRPSVLMHIDPWTGKPVNIGKAVMDMLFR